MWNFSSDSSEERVSFVSNEQDRRVWVGGLWRRPVLASLLLIYILTWLYVVCSYIYCSYLHLASAVYMLRFQVSVPADSSPIWIFFRGRRQELLKHDCYCFVFEMCLLLFVFSEINYWVKAFSRGWLRFIHKIWQGNLERIYRIWPHLESFLFKWSECQSQKKIK